MAAYANTRILTLKKSILTLIMLLSVQACLLAFIISGITDINQAHRMLNGEIDPGELNGIPMGRIENLLKRERYVQEAEHLLYEREALVEKREKNTEHLDPDKVDMASYFIWSGRIEGAIKAETHKINENRLKLSMQEGSPYLEGIYNITNGDELFSIANKWIENEIFSFQNPKSCEDAHYLYCPMVNTNVCGAGCAFHQMAYCGMIALATRRTVIIADGWHYLRQCPEGPKLTCVFEPDSCCPTTDKMKDSTYALPWSADVENRHLQYSRVDYFSRQAFHQNFYAWAVTEGMRIFQTPFWIPPEIKDIITQVHDDPRVWLVGHLQKYIMRNNPYVTKTISEENKQIMEQWVHPIAGMHVRRSDKVDDEAEFHPLEQYVNSTEAWFRKNNIVGNNRRIFLATDDPNLAEQAIKEYPEYKWISGSGKSRNAGTDMNDPVRTSLGGILGLLADIKFLSETDNIVCTLSSQVCRISYELMSTRYRDTNDRITTLDEEWYFP